MTIDPTDVDVASAVGTIWSVFTGNLPIVMALVGGLIAVGLIIRFLRRNAK